MNGIIGAIQREATSANVGISRMPIGESISMPANYGMVNTYENQQERQPIGQGQPKVLQVQEPTTAVFAQQKKWRKTIGKDLSTFNGKTTLA